MLTLALIHTEGEPTDGHSRAVKLGYTVELFPSTQDIHLNDSKDEELIPWLQGGGNTTTPTICEERLHVRSLRQSWVDILHQYADHDDSIIFGENDTIPRVRAQTLSLILTEARNAHPDADVYRLFLYLDYYRETYSSLRFLTHVDFSHYKVQPQRGTGAYFYGTHALWIPTKDSRKKVADVIDNYRLPTDTAIEAATYFGDLKTVVAAKNLFVQQQ